MNRLTSDSDYLASKEAYEQMGLTPEQLMEVDRLYLEKCEEVNRLVVELKKVCNNCRYSHLAPGAYPCRECSHNYKEKQEERR